MIRINKAQFLEILERVKPAINKSVIENNNNKIYLSIQENLLFVNAFHISENINIHTYMECETDSDTLIDNNTRELIIDYNMLYKTWKELTSLEVVTIELPEHLNNANKLSKNKSIKIKSGLNTYTLKVVETDKLQVYNNLTFLEQDKIKIDGEYPLFEKISISSSSFINASLACLFLVPNKDDLSKMNMSGILVNEDCLVATNGFAIGKILVENNSFNNEKKSCFLTPHTIRCVQSIIKTNDEQSNIDILFSPTLAYIYYKNYTIISSQFENKFPNYEKVMNEYENYNSFVCEKEILLKTLNRMMLYAPKDKNYKTKIFVNDSSISFNTYNHSNELGASEDINCITDIKDTDNTKIYFSCETLKNIISKIAINKSENIYIFFNGQKDHIIIRDKNDIYHYRMTQILHDE